MITYEWKKSSRSGAGGGTNDCVEARLAPDGMAVEVQDSKDPGRRLRFSPQGWDGLLAALRD